MPVIKHSTATRNAMAVAAVSQLDAGTGPGKIEIRSGTMPATPQTAASGTLLATVTLSDPAGGAASTGTVTITDPASVTGVAAGTATWARLMSSDGAVVFADVDVTATGGGGSIQLSTTTISVGVTVDMGAITYSVAE